MYEERETFEEYNRYTVKAMRSSLEMVRLTTAPLLALRFIAEMKQRQKHMLNSWG